MTAHSEIPETMIVPQTNTYNNCRFDVRFDGRISPSFYWIIVLVSSAPGTSVPNDMYIEVWDEAKPLATLNLSHADPSVIPASCIKGTDKGVYFLLKLYKGLIDRSWGAIRVNDAHACVIRFKDWLPAKK